MQYGVAFVADDEMPGGVPWLIVPRTPDGLGPLLFIKESCVSAELLTEVWGAWQAWAAAVTRLPVPRRCRQVYSMARRWPAAVNA